MNGRRPRGIILVLVLAVIAILALATLSFCELMLNERKAALTSGQQIQARTLAESGVELARQFLDRDPDERADAGGVYDNPQRFRDVLAAEVDDARDRGRFTLVAPLINDRTVVGLRYGLQDESTRINLRTLMQTDGRSSGAAKQMLLALPGMTEEISDAILDWIDSDDAPQAQGAEADYYATLSPPYAPRNGPPESIDELLLVRGVTPQLLYGTDAARMGFTDDSASQETIDGVDNSDGSMDHGWAQYLTLFSAESTLKPDGTKKIDLNGDDLETLYNDLKTALDEQSAAFIVAYRAYGPSLSNNGSSGSSSNGAETLSPDQLDFSKLEASASLASILDLIGASVDVPASDGSGGSEGEQGGPVQSARQNVIHLKSPFSDNPGAMAEYLPELMAAATVETAETIHGRININQASRTVLMCIPGMTTDIVDQIISNRVMDPALDDESHHYETWLLSEGIVPLETMKTLMPMITAGGSVYRAQVIGRLDGGGPSVRLEVIFDAGKRPTRLLSWKEVSGLPGGFPAEAAATAHPADQ